MSTSMMIEIAGYIGSTLVVVSMLMSSVVKLRLINTIGSMISATYALIIHSYPLALMNICLIIINVYNLVKLLKSDKEYDLVNGKEDDRFLDYFLDHYREDILKYFPAKSLSLEKADEIYMVCCNATPAGVLLGTKKESGVLELVLDYSTPVYRDCSVGKFLYAKLAEQGYRSLVCSQPKEEHKSYLTKMGFVNENGAYVKKL